MKVGDLVKSSKDTSLSASVGVVVGERAERPTLKQTQSVFGKRLKWVRVFYASELGKEFSPVDGVFLVREDHLEVIGERD